MALPLWLAARAAIAKAAPAIGRAVGQQAPKFAGSLVRSKIMGWNPSWGFRYTAMREVFDPALARAGQKVANSPLGVASARLTNRFTSEDAAHRAYAFSQGVRTDAPQRSITRRFAGSGANQFVVDYAAAQLVHALWQGTEEVVPEVGFSDKNEAFDIQPYQHDLALQAGGRPLLSEEQLEGAPETEGRPLFNETLAIAASALIGGRVAGLANKFRKTSTSFNLVQKSVIPNPTRAPGESVASFAKSTIVTRAARGKETLGNAATHYSALKPELAGRVVGTSAALLALGASPEQAAQALLARGAAATISTGARSTQPGEFNLPKTPPTIKKINKIKQVQKRANQPINWNPRTW